MSTQVATVDQRAPVGDAWTWGELYVAAYVQSLHHDVERHNDPEAIYHGEIRPYWNVTSEARRAIICGVISILADTTTEWLSATAVSIAIYGSSKTLLPENMQHKPQNNAAAEHKAQEQRRAGIQVNNIEIYIAQSRERIPQIEIEKLADILQAVQERVMNGRPFRVGVDPDIEDLIGPLIVRLCEHKMMAILSQFALMDRIWRDTCRMSDHDSNCQVPADLKEMFEEIRELIILTLDRARTDYERKGLLVEIMRRCFRMRTLMDSDANIIDNMERNWGFVLANQLRAGIGPHSKLGVPTKYARDVFGGWIAPTFYDAELEPVEPGFEGPANLVLHERKFTRCSISHALVREYVAHNGIYSRVCPRFPDGQPLSPISRFVGQLGKYYQAAVLLLHTPLYPNNEVRPTELIVNIRIMPVGQDWYMRPCTANSRPEVPLDYDTFLKDLTSDDFDTASLFGSKNVQDGFRKNWAKARHEQRYHVHPELKLLTFNALNFRVERALILRERESPKRTGAKRRPMAMLLSCKREVSIGTSRSSCFACRAVLGGWNANCHCHNMLMDGGCEPCEDFELEPLLCNLKITLCPAGERYTRPRNYLFDPTWLAPLTTRVLMEEYGHDPVFAPLADILHKLSTRALGAVRTELYGMLAVGTLQEQLEYAASDEKDEDSDVSDGSYDGIAEPDPTKYPRRFFRVRHYRNSCPPEINYFSPPISFRRMRLRIFRFTPRLGRKLVKFGRFLLWKSRIARRNKTGEPQTTEETVLQANTENDHANPLAMEQPQSDAGEAPGSYFETAEMTTFSSSPYLGASSVPPATPSLPPASFSLYVTPPTPAVTGEHLLPPTHQQESQFDKFTIPGLEDKQWIFPEAANPLEMTMESLPTLDHHHAVLNQEAPSFQSQLNSHLPAGSAYDIEDTHSNRSREHHQAGGLQAGVLLRPTPPVADAPGLQPSGWNRPELQLQPAYSPPVTHSAAVQPFTHNVNMMYNPPPHAYSWQMPQMHVPKLGQVVQPPRQLPVGGNVYGTIPQNKPASTRAGTRSGNQIWDDQEPSPGYDDDDEEFVYEY